MKRNLALVAAIVFGSILSGCVPVVSLFSLFTNEDKLFDQQLLGEWRQVQPPAKENAKEARWIFAPGKDDVSYDVTLSAMEGKEKPVWVSSARMVKLDKFLFMDFGTPYPDDHEFELFPYPLVAGHMIARIRVDKKSVRMDFLSDDWIKYQVRDGKLAIASIDADGERVLTATTAELRKFVQAHAEDKEAFSETYELARVK